MNGKYRSRKSYAAARLKRGALRLLLSRLLRWEPMRSRHEGYTLIVACHGPLAEMMLPSIDLLARQDLTNLRRLIVSFDAPEDPRLRQLAKTLAQQYPHLNSAFVFQTQRESRLLRRIDWGWIDCWLSYAKGIGAADTRYAILHDMDAMLIRPDLIERRYQLIREREDHFLGIRWYKGNGIVAEDQLAYIVEMAFDAEFLRRECRPLDLFNVIGRLDDRTVDFDTLLYPQTRTPRRSVEHIDEEEMVHPSQVVSQYTMLNRRDYVPPAANNALFIPYFYYLAGQPRHLRSARASLDSAEPRIPLLNKSMDISRLSPLHADWLTEQAMRIEGAIAAESRREIIGYFESVRRAAQRNDAA